MTTSIEYPHLQSIGDQIHIGQTRYTVLHIAGEHYHYGWSADELLRQHPDLQPEEIYAALTYFYDHFDELVVALTARAEAAETIRTPGPSRAELLRRRKGTA